MPNLIAYAALALWPVVTVWLFVRLPPGRALIAAMLASYLLLPPPPAGFDLPLIPSLTKDVIPVVAAALMAVVLHRDGMRIWPQSIAARVLVVLFVFSPVMTVMTNAEPVFYGRVGLPGLGAKDMLALVIQQVIMIAPFLMARHFLSSATDLRDLLLALFLGGLVYTLPMLVELRLSPQMNVWVYGYFQHLFEQMTRGEGYRPIVFLYHALWVAFFTMTAVLAGAALARSETGRQRVMFLLGTAYLLVVLLLCKSMASILYALAFAPLVLLAGARLQLRVALVLALLALAYPVAKGSGLVPSEAMLDMARAVSGDRAHSLGFRFANEDILLTRAEEKPLFGWGSWGRNHILNPETGAIMTITDGRWIIVIGVFGWLGYIAEFGLFALPLVLLWRHARDPAAISPFVGPLALILGINMIDLIPNATITPLTWLFAGALLGHAERLAQGSAATDDAATPLPRAEPAFRTVI